MRSTSTAGFTSRRSRRDDHQSRSGRRALGRRHARARRRRQDRLQCLPGAVPDQRRAHRRVRSLRQLGRRTDASRSAARDVAHGRWRWGGGAVRLRHALGRASRPGPGVRDRRRLGHDLSRLQARAVHRVVAARGGGRGDRRDRGHLQLLQFQGEDRHRSLHRPRVRAGARARRGGGPRYDAGVRLADAVARRRAPSHRRQQEGGPRHLRRDVGARQPAARRARDRRRRRTRRAGRVRPGDRRCARAPHASRLRLGDHRHLRAAMVRPRRRGDRRRRSHHRGAERASGRALPRHAGRRRQGGRPQVDPRPLLPGRKPRVGLGRDRYHRSAEDHQVRRPRDGMAGRADPDGLDDRGGLRVLCARRGLADGAGRHPRGGEEGGRAHRRELRAGALHRALHGWGGRVACARGSPRTRLR